MTAHSYQVFPSTLTRFIPNDSMMSLVIILRALAAARRLALALAVLRACVKSND